jgi:hypothetical protein
MKSSPQVKSGACVAAAAEQKIMRLSLALLIDVSFSSF